ncbi:MAG: hypothetical protein Kow00121_19560 [Elainellaceae cyanobacterium]
MIKHLQFVLILMAGITAFELGDRSSYATPQPSLLAHEAQEAAPAHLEPTSDAAVPMDDHHEHGRMEVEGQPIPTVNLVVHPDARQGWNLEVQVAHFRFAPEQVNQPGPTDEGHAHLYVNGIKVARLYGPWYYLESLPAGRYELAVSLNTNDHQTLTHNGQLIQSVVVLEVP